MTQLAAILFSALFTFAVCLCAGKLVLQSLRAKLYRSEEFFLGFVLGSACLSTLVFLLAATGLAYPAIFLAAGLVIVALALWRGAHRFSSERLPSLPRLWGACFWTIYALFAILYLGHALLPETAPDATAYHLALPASYLREHSLPFKIRNMMASLSEGIEMLFLFAYPFGKYSAGSMVHYLFCLMTPLGMLSYARRVGMPEAGMAGALLFFASPVVGRLGTIGYIDVAVAAVVFAVFYLVEIWREHQFAPLLVAIGLLAGFGFATKYTAFLTLPYALGIILYERVLSKRTQSRRSEFFWQPLLLTAACALVTMAPYLVKNAITVGNPLVPFANRFFPNPLMTVLLEDRYADVMRHWNGVQMWEIPREILIGGSRLQGIVGPVFALAPLALLGLWSPVGRRLLLAAGVFGATYFASIGTRFLVPAETFIALALAAWLAQWRWSRALLVILVLAHAVLSWPRILPLYTDRYAWILPRLPVRVAMRIRPEAEYLRQNIGDYDMAFLIDRTVPAGEPVLATATFANLFQSHEIIVGWQSAPGQRLFDVLAAAVSTVLDPSIHHEFQFAPRPVRKLRLVRQDSAPRDWMKNEWSISELRIFSNKVEVPRSPVWRLRASHNPTAVPLAFDGNLVTRWTSGEPLSPGMWLEVDLGAETKVDAVIVQSTSDQPPTPLRLEFETAAGRWEHPDVSLAIGRRRASPDLRRMATETLKLNAMHWLLVEPSAPFAEDMASHPAQWGVALAAASGRWRLYRLE